MNRLRRTIYGEPAICGYSSETGGKLVRFASARAPTPVSDTHPALQANLRSLTNATVRQYHGDFYRPENLCIVVVGPVAAAELLAALAPVERELIASRTAPTTPTPPTPPRPWQRAVPPFAPTTDDRVVRHAIEFAEDDEASGLMLWAVA